MTCKECQDEAVVPARDVDRDGPADLVIGCDHGDTVPVVPLPRMPMPPPRLVGRVTGSGKAIVRGVKMGGEWR